MINALDSGWRGPVSGLCWISMLCSLAKHFTFAVPLSIQMKFWGGGGGNHAMDYYSIQGGVAILLISSC